MEHGEGTGVDEGRKGRVSDAGKVGGEGGKAGLEGEG